MQETTRKKLQNYFEKYPIIKYKKRQIILKPGDEVPFIGFTKSGYVRVYNINENGQETTIQILKPIFSFTTIYAITGEKNKYFFEAISPVELWTAPKDKTLEFMRADKELSDELTKLFLGYYLDLIDRLHLMLAGNASTKVMGVLTSLAEKFGEKSEKKTVIPLSVPHRLIASMTGLTRETVTLQILKLQKQGLIENKGKRISIKNVTTHDNNRELYQ
jgi:CRP-like cAMP-binding protein